MHAYSYQYACGYMSSFVSRWDFKAHIFRRSWHIVIIAPRVRWVARTVTGVQLYCIMDSKMNFKTHRGRVTHICVCNLTIIGSDNGLSAPSHYLNQCWNTVNWTPSNKLQWNVNRNSYIFIQENPFENVVCKMAAILSRPQCVILSDTFTTHYIKLFLSGMRANMPVKIVF